MTSVDINPVDASTADSAAADTATRVDPRTTAVVLIEYQNDFTSDGGALHEAVADSMAATDMLAHTREVLAAARAGGATVLHAPISFAPGHPEITRGAYGILAGVVAADAFVAGTWGAAIAEDVAPAPGEIVVEGKRGLDTFATTNLDFILRRQGIRTLVLGGFLTNCCVESTMRTGYEKGYQVITLTDCVAATSAAEHDNAIAYDYGMFSTPMTGKEFVSALSGADPAAGGVGAEVPRDS